MRAVAPVWESRAAGECECPAQQVLNFRAAMLAAGTWDEVGTITFGHVEMNKDGTFKLFVIRDWGSYLSFTTTRDIYPDLEKAGYRFMDKLLTSK